MPDPTNENIIVALLDYLRRMDMSNMHAGLSALVAERDELKQRVAVLESQEFTLPTDPFRDPDRDLRERLVCAIWPEIMRQWREFKTAIDPRGDARSDALIEADKMLAAMRKGEADGK